MRNVTCKVDTQSPERESTVSLLPTEWPGPRAPGRGVRGPGHSVGSKDTVDSRSGALRVYLAGHVAHPPPEER